MNGKALTHNECKRLAEDISNEVIEKLIARGWTPTQDERNIYRLGYRTGFVRCFVCLSQKGIITVLPDNSKTLSITKSKDEC